MTTPPRIQIPKQPEDVEQVRDFLRALIEKGHPDQAVDQVVRVLEQMRQLNCALELRNHELLRKLYGKRSEKLDPAQLALFCASLTGLQQDAPQAPDSGSQGDAPGAGTDPGPDAPPKKPDKARKHPGRNPLPAHLPRETVVLTPAPEQCACPIHGPKVVIGVETSETLEYVPGSFKVILYERPTLACPEGCEGEVVVAPPADKIVERGLAGPGLLADLLTKKFRFSLPIDRIHHMYAQEQVQLATSTLGDWIAQTTDLLEPIAKVLGRLVLEGHVLGVDDTVLPVLDRDHPKGIKRGHMWAYVSDGGYIVYEYTPNWKGEHPRAILAQRVGIIQGDDYAGYAPLFGPDSPRIKAGCWSHVRRKFEGAEQSGDHRAGFALAIISSFYETERLATAEEVSVQERTRRRQLGTRPAIEQLGDWARKLQLTLVPGTPLAKAIGYMLKQWQDLLVFLDDGRVSPDNNWVEQKVRPIAVGRKAYLFAGSDAGARRAAIAYTIIGNCLLAGIDPWRYIRDVLTKLAAGWPASRITELLPQAWAEHHRQECAAEPGPVPD